MNKIDILRDKYKESKTAQLALDLLEGRKIVVDNERRRAVILTLAVRFADVVGQDVKGIIVVSDDI